MFNNLREKITFSGITVLGIGIALLIFTFFSAYGFLTAVLSPISAQDLAQTFGEALGPLIAASIHIMYLGIMGWIGSLITIRGVTIMLKVHEIKHEVIHTPEELQKSQLRSKNERAKSKEKAKPETAPVEPEMIVIPMEEIEQKPQTKRKPKH